MNNISGINKIPGMRTFALEEMAILFANCYESLHLAYQNTMQNDLLVLSEEAYHAGQYLMNEIHRKNNYITH